MKHTNILTSIANYPFTVLLFLICITALRIQQVGFDIFDTPTVIMLGITIFWGLRIVEKQYTASWLNKNIIAPIADYRVIKPLYLSCLIAVYIQHIGFDAMAALYLCVAIWWFREIMNGADKPNASMPLFAILFISIRIRETGLATPNALLFGALVLWMVNVFSETTKNNYTSWLSNN